MTTHVQDDGFHEIQLNGKQLFFLFMATTVVSVVIFLCGVLVGRGVRVERTAMLSTVTEEAAPTAAPPAPAALPAPVNAEPLPSSPPPSSPAGEDELKPVAASVAAPRADPAKAEAKTTGSAAALPADSKQDDAKPAPSKTDSRTSSQSFVVQVAAYDTRGGADALAKRLTSKGYSAYVATSGGMFRVRVGPYASHADAEAAADKLGKQEGKKPWITH